MVDNPITATGGGSREPKKDVNPAGALIPYYERQCSREPKKDVNRLSNQRALNHQACSREPKKDVNGFPHSTLP